MWDVWETQQGKNESEIYKTLLKTYFVKIWETSWEGLHCAGLFYKNFYIIHKSFQ